MKLDEGHTVPCEQAVALLKALPHVGDYVFPGAVEGKPLSDMALMQLLRGMDANGYKVHGFRSAFRDWAGDETDFETKQSNLHSRIVSLTALRPPIGAIARSISARC